MVKIFKISNFDIALRLEIYPLEVECPIATTSYRSTIGFQRHHNIYFCIGSICPKFEKFKTYIMYESTSILFII